MKHLSIHLPSIRCLKAFEASARLESFSAAARELHTSQSSISRHVCELEAILGSPLFERRKQRVCLTEQGKHLQRRVGQGLDTILDGLLKVANWDADVPVTIGCTHAISHLLIMPVFEALQSAMSDYGKVRIMTTEYAILDAQSDAQVDIRFDYDVSDIPPEDCALLFSEAVKPVCSPEFKQRHADTLAISPAHWSELPILDLSLPNRGWVSWADWFEMHASQPAQHDVTLFENYIYLLEACASGRGLALGSRGMVDNYLSNGRLVEAHGNYVEYDRGIYAVLTERGRTKAAPRACLKALAGMFTSNKRNASS